MMLWVDIQLRFYVVIEPYYVFWQVEQPILLFIYFDYYVIVTDVIVTRPGVFKAHLFILSLWFTML